LQKQAPRMRTQQAQEDSLTKIMKVLQIKNAMQEMQDYESNKEFRNNERFIQNDLRTAQLENTQQEIAINKQLKTEIDAIYNKDLPTDDEKTLFINENEYAQYKRNLEVAQAKQKLGLASNTQDIRLMSEQLARMKQSNDMGQYYYNQLQKNQYYEPEKAKELVNAYIVNPENPIVGAKELEKMMETQTKGLLGSSILERLKSHVTIMSSFKKSNLINQEQFKQVVNSVYSLDGIDKAIETGNDEALKYVQDLEGELRKMILSHYEDKDKASNELGYQESLLALKQKYHYIQTINDIKIAKQSDLLNPSVQANIARQLTSTLRGMQDLQKGGMLSDKRKRYKERLENITEALQRGTLTIAQLEEQNGKFDQLMEEMLNESFQSLEGIGKVKPSSASSSQGTEEEPKVEPSLLFK